MCTSSILTLVVLLCIRPLVAYRGRLLCLLVRIAKNMFFSSRAWVFRPAITKSLRALSSKVKWAWFFKDCAKQRYEKPLVKRDVKPFHAAVPCELQTFLSSISSLVHREVDKANMAVRCNRRRLLIKLLLSQRIRTALSRCCLLTRAVAWLTSRCPQLTTIVLAISPPKSMLSLLVSTHTASPRACIRLALSSGRERSMIGLLASLLAQLLVACLSLLKHTKNLAK